MKAINFVPIPRYCEGKTRNVLKRSSTSSCRKLCVSYAEKLEFIFLGLMHTFRKCAEIHNGHRMVPVAASAMTVVVGGIHYSKTEKVKKNKVNDVRPNLLFALHKISN